MPSSKTKSASCPCRRPGVLSAALLLGFGLSSAAAQAPLPLPPNYRTTLQNADLLVMKVHYGAHEFVPMHDHTAFPTVYLYLNNSGEVQLKHEGENGFVATRPPTHAGAWRISPGMAERHSVQSLSDTPSDFLRIELKAIPTESVKKVVRGDAPPPDFTGNRPEMNDAGLKIDRTVCPAATACTLPAGEYRSVLAAIVPMGIKLNGHDKQLAAGDAVWLPEGSAPLPLSAGAQCLRVSLRYPAAKP